MLFNYLIVSEKHGVLPVTFVLGEKLGSLMIF